MTINLLDFDAADLTAFFAEHGEKPFRAKQVLRWMHRFGQSDFDAMTDIAKSLREKLKVVASVTPPAIAAATIWGDVHRFTSARLCRVVVQRSAVPASQDRCRSLV